MSKLPRAPRLRPWLMLFASFGVAACWAGASLGLDLQTLLPGSANTLIIKRFFNAALNPAFTYEGEVPPGTVPLLVKALQAAGYTVVFAAAAMSIALLIGLPLGVIASSTWWFSARGAFRFNGLRGTAFATTRFLITLLRSVHELLWAVLFLAAFGLTPFSALLALAIPYSGILAKGVSELLDEAPRAPGEALQAAGADRVQSFTFGVFPSAAPDIIAYYLYLFECALRSSAVLGFFGFPTLGYFLSASFENLYYREVWTYLYAMFALIVVTDIWSSAVRRRLSL